MSPFGRDAIAQVPGHQLAVRGRLCVAKHPVLASLRKANVQCFKSV